MSAPAVIMPRKRFANRPANTAAVLFKTFFIRLYIALDKTQRERAAKVIQQYGHLISKRVEDCGEQKRAFLSEESGSESRQIWPDIARNREDRG
jgi:hypothetical protein